MTHYTQHVAGEMGPERIQFCIHCGALLMDATNLDVEAKGFSVGPVYAGDNSLGPHRTKYILDDDTFEKCPRRRRGLLLF